MYWRLSDTVTVCAASDHILFLDVGRDRYFTLPPTATGPFLDWLKQPATELPGCCRPILRELALIGPEDEQDLAATPCHVARPEPFDAAWLPPAPIRPSVLLGVGMAVASAWHEVRTQPLRTVLGRRLATDGRAGQPSGDLTVRLAEFRSARPFIPVPRICLHDCLALIDWLGPGCGIQLVFGVSAYPFAAHCWLQADGRLLDDHPDSPSRFQPILHLP